MLPTGPVANAIERDIARTAAASWTNHNLNNLPRWYEHGHGKTALQSQLSFVPLRKLEYRGLTSTSCPILTRVLDLVMLPTEKGPWCHAEMQNRIHVFTLGAGVGMACAADLTPKNEPEIPSEPKPLADMHCTTLAVKKQRLSLVPHPQRTSRVPTALTRSSN